MGQKRLEEFETFMLSVIEDRRRGFAAGALRFCLKQLSHLYRSIVEFRLWLFRTGIFRHHTLGCQVVSVGNLTVGGTGKTPIVEIFARSLQQSGRRVAILSRGYKRVEPTFSERMRKRFRYSSKSPRPSIVVSDGKRLLSNSESSGDEPYMLASNLPDVAVLVDKNRIVSGQYAIAELGCDTLILDDGFQYLSLKHRLDIVLVDSRNPFGNEHVLPRGILRERVANIRRASFIFITKCAEGGVPELKSRLRRLNPDAEIAECRHSPRYLQNVYSGKRHELTMLNGKKVAAVSGIAVPEGFETELEKLGASVLMRNRYADHHRYTQQEILDVINKGLQTGVDMIVTTEKDAVRFPMIERRDLPIYFLRVEIEMLSGEEDFNHCIKRICFES